MFRFATSSASQGDQIREGDKVMVSLEEKDGQKVVSSVEVTGK